MQSDWWKRIQKKIDGRGDYEDMILKSVENNEHIAIYGIYYWIPLALWSIQHNISGPKQVSRAGKSNYIPQ